MSRILKVEKVDEVELNRNVKEKWKNDQWLFSSSMNWPFTRVLGKVDCAYREIRKTIRQEEGGKAEMEGNGGG